MSGPLFHTRSPGDKERGLEEESQEDRSDGRNNRRKEGHNYCGVKSSSGQLPRFREGVAVDKQACDREWNDSHQENDEESGVPHAHSAPISLPETRRQLPGEPAADLAVRCRRRGLPLCGMCRRCGMRMGSNCDFMPSPRIGRCRSGCLYAGSGLGIHCPGHAAVDLPGVLSNNVHSNGVSAIRFRRF
jgi:hypothetical protein